jgi:ABC-type Fe3+-hydroxamate transport system substrate-binding protein
MRSFSDQAGNSVYLQHCPQRIISLVPSQTELLYYLNLENEVKAITKFCIHPPHWFQNKEKIGGTKKINLDKIMQLKPDLIIANKEENEKEQVEELHKHFPVWLSDIKTLDDAMQMIESIGQITCRIPKAKELITDLVDVFSPLKSRMKREDDMIPTAYLIWKNPYMAAGGDTFINDMMQLCGLRNVFSNAARYPVIEVSELRERGCRLLLLSSEPFPFREKHVKELKTALPGISIMLVDGEMFSWYGSRLLIAGEYFKKLVQDLRSMTL